MAKMTGWQPISRLNCISYCSRNAYILFLNGYFDSGYLGYEAAAGIDWIWEHRMEDLLCLDLTK